MHKLLSGYSSYTSIQKDFPLDHILPNLHRIKTVITNNVGTIPYYVEINEENKGMNNYNNIYKKIYIQYLHDTFMV